MSQHDLDLAANQSGTSLRTDINGALEALATLQAGAVGTLPATYANMLHADTSSGHIQKRNNGDTDWDYITPIDQRIITSAIGTDAYAITLSPVLGSYKNGVIYRFKADVANTGTASLDINSLGVKTLKKWANGSLSTLDSGDIPVGGMVMAMFDSVNDCMIVLNPARSPVGHVVQEVSFSDADYMYGSTLIPWDDTIPGKAEGDEYLSVSITPKRSSNILKIFVLLNVANSASIQGITLALFKEVSGVHDDYAMATVGVVPTGIDYTIPAVLVHRVAAGTTSEITFNVRAGVNASGYLLVNGVSSLGRLNGGVRYSYIIVTETES